MNRVMLVYKSLGQLLNNPLAFGLGERAPKPLVQAVSAMRQTLRQELAEEEELSCEDWLAGELAQDADRQRRPAIHLVRRRSNG